ncbi:MAG: FHA domain-containing protein, partial [Clostridiales Family XIII bacterium]|nr:FHA domain-containing protein [Clostridiales Family XIII bacterium]
PPVAPSAAQRPPAFQSPAPPPGVGSGIANFGETTLLGAQQGGTTVLSPEAGGRQSGTAYLVRVKTGERIEINGDFLRIGSEANYADYCIMDNRAISRSHATIKKREGEFFIVDTNSTNHTFVDSIMLQSNIEVKLSHGTKIRLGNEEFVFYLY